MRIAVLIATIVLFFTCTGSAWPDFQAILDLFKPASRVPQFLQDSKHPWLDDKRSFLNSLDDPTAALCNLNSTIRPGNSDSGTYPVDLFRQLAINNNIGLAEGEKSRGGWANAVARLKEMLVCPAALLDVQDFRVEIYVSDGRYGIGVKEPREPPVELPSLFIQALSSMPNLAKLDWKTHGNGIDEFRKTFNESDLKLPSIQHLKLPNHMDILVPLCPNLETLESNERIWTRVWSHFTAPDAAVSFIQSARNARKITDFSLTTDWRSELLEEVSQAMPNLVSLDIGGRLQKGRFDNSQNASFAQNLKSHAEILPRFQSLKHLILPGTGRLDMDFDGGAWCGNSYFGAEGREYGRSVSRKDAETTEQAVTILLPFVSQLESLWIGGRRVNLTRDEQGVLNVTWPWTGRIDEWTHEIWDTRRSIAKPMRGRTADQ